MLEKRLYMGGGARVLGNVLLLADMVAVLFGGLWWFGVFW